MKANTQSLTKDLVLLLQHLPPGYIMTYGDIARYLGCHSRQTSRLLAQTDSALPWHRVVNHAGKISLTGAQYQLQKLKLLKEGVVFDTHDRVDLKHYRWQPPELFFSMYNEN